MLPMLHWPESVEDLVGWYNLKMQLVLDDVQLYVLYLKSSNWHYWHSNCSSDESGLLAMARAEMNVAIAMVVLCLMRLHWNVVVVVVVVVVVAVVVAIAIVAVVFVVVVSVTDDEIAVVVAESSNVMAQRQDYKMLGVQAYEPMDAVMLQLLLAIDLYNRLLPMAAAKY